MSKVRVNGFSISADGYGAGPEQSLEHPLAGLFDRLFLLLLRQKIQSLLDDLPQPRGSIHPTAFVDLIRDCLR